MMRMAEEKRRREELEEEGRRNVGKLPDILNRDEDEDGSEDDFYADDGGGKPRAKSRSSSYQPTPKQPGWTNRLMHQAMGVPTKDSPQYTLLSRVSTTAPSTRGSIDTIATKPRHGLRAEQSEL